jgi:hypothetical protein
MKVPHLHSSCQRLTTHVDRRSSRGRWQQRAWSLPKWALDPTKVYRWARGMPTATRNQSSECSRDKRHCRRKQ